MKRHCGKCGLPGHDRRSHRRNPPTFKGKKDGAPKKLTAKQKAKQYDQRWLFADPKGIGGYEQHHLFDVRKNSGRKKARRRNNGTDGRFPI